MSNSEQGIKEWMESKYDTIDDLIKAFVNDNIPKGNASNLIVYGNTLYVDEGNDGHNLWFFPLAIRLSDDIYIINIRKKHKPCQTKIYKQAAMHSRARYRYIYMPTINHKQENGRVEPSILKSIISGEPPGRVKVEQSRGIIRDMVGALKKVQKAHVLLGGYLDILRQLPEKPEL